MLYRASDELVGRSLDLYGEYCEGAIDLFRRFVGSGSIVVEVGANVGAFTIFFARRVFPGGLVLAFEPRRITFQLLSANLALNSVPNVFCYQQAVGASPGSIVMRPPAAAGSPAGADSAKPQPAERVPLVRLDDFNLPGCSLLRIDAGGMEQDVIEGARGMIGRFKPVIYVRNEDPGKAPGVIRALDSLSYNIYRHEVPYFSPGNFFGNLENVFPGKYAINMACIHRDVTQVLSGAQPVDVPPAPV
jgi:FkbM family methyltransferase